MNNLSVHPVLDFWKFLRRPIAENLSASLSRKLVIVLMIVALDILISLGTGPLTDLMIEVSQFDDQAVAEEFTPTVLLTGVLLVPLIEEVFFRLGLAPNIIFLFITLFSTTVQYAPFPSNLFDEFGVAVAAKVLFYLALSGGICLFFWIRQRKGHPYADFFKRHVAIYCYIGAVWFGLAHIGNYANTPPVWLVPFLLLPQILGGFTFGYLRIRLGFWFGVLAHMLVNLLFNLGDLMNYLVGPQGGVAWFIFLIVFSLITLLLPLITRKRLARADEASV